MNIHVVGIQKTTVANDKIENWVTVTIWIGWIAPENIEDLPPIMLSTWDLTVAAAIPGLFPSL